MFWVGRIFSSFFQFLFFVERTRPATGMRPPYFIFLSASNEATPKKRSDRGRSLPKGKKASSYRGAYRVPIINSLSVCLCVQHPSFLLIARAERGRSPQTRDLWKRASMGSRVGRGSSHAVWRWARSPGCCFRDVFWMGRTFS